MTFTAASMLGWLVVIPVVVAAYVAAGRRRARRAEALAGQGLVTPAPSGAVRRRRHVPFAFFVVALTLLVVALARPATTIKTPQEQGTVVLALDVSNSMRATDVKPSRIAVAKAAATAFVGHQPPAVRIGVVAFGDGAVVVQAPTTVHADVVKAIDHVSIGGGTSVGQGLLTSLDTIAGKQITIDPSALNNDEGSVKVGYYGGTSVVVLSDGENNGTPDPAAVANVMSTAGVRIHSIGVGTEAGTTFQLNGFSIATALDRSLLQQISSVTDGTYHPATDPTAPAAVAKTIKVHLTLVSHHDEITGLLCAIAAGFLLVGALLSVRWFGRIV